jgi:drug/metabolite transporter (DMT)-like permease
MTAAFSSAVPAVAAVLAIPILGETPVAIEWLGIVVVTSGLAVLVRGQG